MKKKILSVLLACMLCLSISACTESASENDINNTDNTDGSLDETGVETASDTDENTTVPAQTVTAEESSTEPVDATTAASEGETASESASQSAAGTTQAAQTTPAQTTVTVPAVTEAPAPKWTETAASGTMYVNTNGIYSRVNAIQGSTRVKQYSLNQAVTVIAKTNTGYYKLGDGEYIHGDYLSTGKVTVTTTTAKPVVTTAQPPVTTTAQTTAADREVGGNYGQRAQTQEEIDFANRVFELTNAERAKVGLAPFKKLDALTKVSNIRAWETSVAWGHKRPDGEGFPSALIENGLKYSYVGENIAGGQATPEEVVEMWMNSEVHKANILDKDFIYMGVGFYKIPGTKYTTYCTQNFYIPL